MGYLDDAKFAYTRYFPEDAAKVAPCSEADVVLLEQQFSARLPLAYREFLTWMGRGGEDIFWTGFTWTFGSLRDINVWAHELVQISDTKLRLPKDAFVFFWDGGAIFYFFKLKDGDDPPVYFFMESNLEANLRQGFTAEPKDDPVVRYLLDDRERTDFFRLSSNFSQFILSEVQRCIRLQQDKGTHRKQR